MRHSTYVTAAPAGLLLPEPGHIRMASTPRSRGRVPTGTVLAAVGSVHQYGRHTSIGAVGRLMHEVEAGRLGTACAQLSCGHFRAGRRAGLQDDPAVEPGGVAVSAKSCRKTVRDTTNHENCRHR